MALPATSSPTSQWQFEHAQPSHRNSPHGQKRSLSDRDDNDLQSPINSFKRLRINHAPLPQRFGRVSYRAPTSEDQHEIDAYHGPHEDDYDHTTHTSNGYPEQQSLHAPSPQQKHQSSYLSHHPTQSEHQDDHSMHIDTNSPKPHPQSHLFPLHDRQYTSTPPPARAQSDLSDFMSLDSSSHPHKVVISDLDAELAEIEAEEAAQKAREQESNFFLPEDVQKEINGIPEHILKGSGGAPSSSHQKVPSSALVLYRPPPVLNVPEDKTAEEKGLRKSILEERRRERREREEQEQQQEGIREGKPGHEIEIGREAEGYTNHYGSEFANRIRTGHMPWYANAASQRPRVQPRQEQTAEDGEMEWEPDEMEIE